MTIINLAIIYLFASFLTIAFLALMFKALSERKTLRPDQAEAVRNVLNANRYCEFNPEHRKIAVMVTQVLHQYDRTPIDDATQKEIEKINKMPHIDMARLYRFAESGHPYFVMSSPLRTAFMERFKAFGGMTTEISKKIGWTKIS